MVLAHKPKDVQSNTLGCRALIIVSSEFSQMAPISVLMVVS